MTSNSNHLNAATHALISCIALTFTVPALAEWVVAARDFAGRPIEINTSSLKRQATYLRYLSRRTALPTGILEVDTVVDCVERMRGNWTEFKFYPVYPNTGNGDEVDVACNFAQRLGILPSELAQKGPAKPSPPSVDAVPAPEPQPKKVIRYSGSGFYINTTNVVTNFHVIKDCTKYLVLRNGTEFIATVNATDRRNDLAILQVTSPPTVVPSLRSTATLGEDVMVAGHPLTGLLGSDIIVTSGQVNSLTGIGNDPTYVQISAPVQSGNSGGPVVDRSGNIVGVVVSKVDALKVAQVTGDMTQNINFAIKPEILRLFLESNRILYRISPNKKQAQLNGTELAQRARGFTVQVICTP